MSVSGSGARQRDAGQHGVGIAEAQRDRPGADRTSLHGERRAAVPAACDHEQRRTRGYAGRECRIDADSQFDRGGCRGRPCLRSRLALRLFELGQSFGEHLAQVGGQLVILQLDPALLRQRHVAATVGNDAAVPQGPRIVRRHFEPAFE